MAFPPGVSPEEKFVKAVAEWDLDRLYSDLTLAKKRWSPSSRLGLSESEREHLLGLLSGYSPEEIAQKLDKDVGGLLTTLSRTLYRYAEILTRREPKSLKNWRDIIDWLEPQYKYKKCCNPEPIEFESLHEMPVVSSFYDRGEELSQLQQWILEEHCQLIAIIGMGGIGKTALAAHLCQILKQQYEILIWRRLTHAPSITELLKSIVEPIASLSGLAEDYQSLSSQFKEILRQHKCSIVLDGFESVFSPRSLAGKYKEGYHNYGQLLKDVGEINHQSSVIITSLEKPKELVFLEKDRGLVRSLKLSGLSKQGCFGIFKEKGLFAEASWSQLVKRYRGNPLALKIISSTILDIFNGEVSDFLDQNTIFVGQVSEVLKQQCDRLSSLEIQLMYHLAIADRPLDISDLRHRLVTSVNTSKIMEAIESLVSRSLVEKYSDRNKLSFTLQPIVMKYIINNFQKP
jgi:hypothetical protein